jgi:hypothetical protein
MSEQYLLYPSLSEEAQKQAKELMEQFKAEMLKVCDATLETLYCDVSCYIESDHWTNYRNELLDGFRNYNNRKVQGQHDFAKIRAEIYKEYRDELIPDLNQDMLAEIESLKQQIKWMEESRRHSY